MSDGTRHLISEAFDRIEAGDTPPPPPEPPTRRVTLTPAASIKPLPVRWTWQDRIPAGELTLTPGLGGIGKSTFHAWMIAQITRGLLPGIHKGTPRAAMICAVEDSWERVIVPRLIAADADLNLVYKAEVSTDEDDNLRLTLPVDTDAVMEAVVEHRIAVVSIDPLLSAINLELDSFKSRDVREALEPLAAMADDTGAVVLGNAHFNKSTGADPLLRIANSTAFGEVARAAIGFAYDRDEETFVLSQVKNNLGRLDLPHLTYRIESAEIATERGPSYVSRLVFTGETSRGVHEVLNPHHDPDRPERDTAKHVILDTLQAGPTSWETIAAVIQKEGVSERTGRRARDELKKDKTIVLTGGGGAPWLWERTDYTPEPAAATLMDDEQVF